MTREEAVRIFSQERTSNDTAGDWIDVFVALGMLKLDEPKNIENRIWAAISGRGFSSPDHVHKVLDECGLKIVEK